MKDEEYQALCQQVLQEGLRRSSGKRTGGWLHVPCPYPHNHDRNHAFLAPEGNCIKCHGKHGVIGLRQICELWGIPWTGGSYEPKTFVPYIPPPKPDVYYNIAWESQLPDEALEYLGGRGIPPKAASFYKLGWTGEDEQLPEWAWHRISIPWRIGGKVVGVKLKKIGKSGYLSLLNSDFSTFFNYTCGEIRVILETELDACALAWQIGKPTLALATPAGSITAFKMSLLTTVRQLWANPDADEAGAKMAKDIQGYRRNVRIVAPLKGKKDLGEGLPELPEWAITLAI